MTLEWTLTLADFSFGAALNLADMAHYLAQAAFPATTAA
jgi:hypothetical protein